MLRNDPVLVNDWHPVATPDQFDEQPILSVRLLGEDLVLWKMDGQYHAWRDLCVHRGAKLSLGKIVDDCLRCPYHGWTYNQEGACVHMPAHPSQTPPVKARVKRYQLQERYGLLWVCLGEPANDIPPFPEDAQPEFVTAVCEPARHVQAHGPRLVENFLDAAHFPYVHAGVLGDPEHPEIGDFQVRIGPDGVESDPIEVYQPDPFGGTAGLVHYTYHAYRPLTAHFSKSVGEGSFGLMLAITPHDELDSTGWFIIAAAQTDEITDSAALKTIYSPRILRIFEEDRVVVESQRPELLPLDLQAELHLRSDRVAIAYRTWLRQLGLSFGVA
ncbi:MAG: Vanillate O-demethylase oxygenase subunit [Ktedonobacterales bacterium]|jgi:phenylpropionate dioxygenase-like ring-hydroxylating dioxygenase large terminal subunit|nr:MAG: Vanillate O-demethylase oxygenase subunit [Ktedonobacterales bacterium]